MIKWSMLWERIAFSKKSSLVIHALIFLSFCSWLQRRQKLCVGICLWCFFFLKPNLFKVVMYIAFPVCHPKKQSCLGKTGGDWLPHAPARRKPSTGAAALTWWHSWGLGACGEPCLLEVVCVPHACTLKGRGVHRRGYHGQEEERSESCVCMCVHIRWLVENTLFGALKSLNFVYINLLFFLSFT